MHSSAKKDKKVVTPYVYDHFLPDYNPNKNNQSTEKNRDMSDKKTKPTEIQHKQQQTKSLNKNTQTELQTLSEQIKRYLTNMQKCEKQQYITRSQKQFKKFIEKEVERLQKVKKQPKPRDNELTMPVIQKQNEIIIQLNQTKIQLEKDLKSVNSQFQLIIQCINKISKAFQNKNNKDLDLVKKKIQNKQKLESVNNLIEILASYIVQERSKSSSSKIIPTAKSKEKQLEQQLKTLKANYTKVQQQQSRLQKLVQNYQKPSSKSSKTDLHKEKNHQLQIETLNKKIHSLEEEIKKKDELINQYENMKRLSDTKINSSTKSIKTQKEVEINDTLNDFMQKALPVLNNGETWEGMFLDFKRRYHRNSLVVFLEAIFRRQRSFELKIAQLQAKLSSIRNNSQPQKSGTGTKIEPETSKINPKTQKQLNNLQKINESLQKIIISMNNNENWAPIVIELKKIISKSIIVTFLQLVLKKDSQEKVLQKSIKQYQTNNESQENFLTHAVESFNKNKEWENSLNEYKKSSQRNTLIVFLQSLNKHFKSLQLKVKQSDQHSADKKTSQQNKRAHESLQKQKNGLLKEKQRIQSILQETKGKLQHSENQIKEMQIKLRSYTDQQSNTKVTKNYKQQLENLNIFIDSLIKTTKNNNWDKQLSQYRKSNPRSPIVNFLDMISRNEKTTQNQLKKLQTIVKKKQQIETQYKQMQIKLQQYQSRFLKQQGNIKIIEELQNKIKQMDRQKVNIGKEKQEFNKTIENLQKSNNQLLLQLSQSQKLTINETQIKVQMNKIISIIKKLCEHMETNVKNYNVNELKNSLKTQFSSKNLKQMRELSNEIQNLVFTFSSNFVQQIQLLRNELKVIFEEIVETVDYVKSGPKPKLQDNNVLGAIRILKSKIKNKINQESNQQEEKLKIIENENVQLKEKYNSIIKELSRLQSHQNQQKLTNQKFKEKYESQINQLKRTFEHERKQMILSINELTNQRNILKKDLESDRNSYRAKIAELYTQLQKQAGTEKQAADFKKVIDKLKSDKQQAQQRFEQEKEQLKKYINKINNDLQAIIISNNEEKKKIRIDLENIREQQYNIQNQKIKKLKQEISQQNEKNAKLIFIIQSNEASFNGLVEQNKSLFQRVINSEKNQQQLRQELQITENKLVQSLEMIDQLLPIEQKINILQKVLASKREEIDIQINIKKIEELEKQNKFLSDKYNEIIYESDSKIHQLRKQLEKLKVQHSFTLSQIKSKQQSIIQLNTIIKSNEKQIGPFNDLLIKYQKLLHENAQLKAKLLSASKVQESNQSNSQLTIKIQYLQQNLLEKDRDIEQIKKQLNSSRLLVQEKNTKIETLMSQIYYLKIMIIQKQKTIETNQVLLKIEKDRFTSQNDNLSKELIRFKTKLTENEILQQKSTISMQSQKQVILK